jgi:hypothetical protein
MSDELHGILGILGLFLGGFMIAYGTWKLGERD